MDINIKLLSTNFNGLVNDKCPQALYDVVNDFRSV